MNNLAIPTTANFVSSVDPLLEAFNIDDMIFRQFGDNFSAAYRLARRIAPMKPVDQVKFYHFEDTRIQELLVVDADATAAGAGQPLVFDLAPASIGPNGEIYARQWFGITFPGGYVKGTITNINGTQITVTPNDGTVTLAVTAGDNLVVTDPNFGEGTTQPKGISPKLIRRDFSTQILKEAFSNSGTAATNRGAVNFRQYAEANGASAELIAKINQLGLGNSYVLLGQYLVDARHSMQVAYMMYFGQENTNNVTPIVDTDPNAADGTIRATKGMYHHIDEGGGRQDYQIGNFALSDYDDIAEYLREQNVSTMSPILHLMGAGQQTEVENAFISSNASTFNKYSTDMANDKIYAGMSKSMNMSFVEATKSSYTFCQVVENMFHDPVGLGAAGYNTKNLGFIIPLEPGKDSKSREQLSRFALRYKQLGGINRAYEVWQRGKEVTGYDINNLELLADMGFQFYGRNQCMILEGQP